MKIALVHDYLSQDGGAERVLASFHNIWPDAPIFVLFHDKQKLQEWNSKDIRESVLSRFPFIRSKYRWYLPFMPHAVERHDLRDFDVVLSSTSAFAKGVLTSPKTIHISYCHTPTRYLWTDTEQYIADLKVNPVAKIVLPRLIHRLRLWDKMSADRVDYFIANSDTVRQRIQKYYRRESDILYPPVDVDKFYISDQVESYFVSGGRIVPYKRFDLLVAAFNRLGYPLKIFGDGPELQRLRECAKPNIEFLGRISDEEKYRVLSKAQAFLHPQVEDLGITAIESMASGRPVIAFGQGGVTETVIPNTTGIFFYTQTWEAIVDAVLDFVSMNWDPYVLRQYAQRYDTQIFERVILQYVTDRHEEFLRGFNQCQLDVRYYDNRN